MPKSLLPGAASGARCGCVFVLVVATAALFGIQQTALAQAEINLPPLADTKSPTGVSFKSGAFNTSNIDLSIGTCDSKGNCSDAP